MFKKSKYFLIVDSVESAIKFYGEKLLFSVIDIGIEAGTNKFINYAELRRGKCTIIVRIPILAELADFSMIRRVNNRASGMYLEVKDGLEAFYSVCKKKKINIISGLSRHSLGYSYFQALDPFGSKLYFYEEEAARLLSEAEKSSFYGLKLKSDFSKIIKDGQTPIEMIDHLKGLGVSRRVSKKFIKLWFLRNYGKNKQDS